jgi:hypothetical protein
MQKCFNLNSRYQNPSANSFTTQLALSKQVIQSPQTDAQRVGGFPSIKDQWFCLHRYAPHILPLRYNTDIRENTGGRYNAKKILPFNYACR